MSHGPSDVSNDWLLSLQSAERGLCKMRQSTPISGIPSHSLSAVLLARDSNSCLDTNTDESTCSEPVLKVKENLPRIPVSRESRRKTEGQGNVKGNGLVAGKSRSRLLPVLGAVEQKRTRLGVEKPSGKKGEILVGAGMVAPRYKHLSLLSKRDSPKMTSGAPSQSVLKMTSGAPSQSVLKMTSGAPSQSVLKTTSGAPSQSVLKTTSGAPSQSVLKTTHGAPSQSVLKTTHGAPCQSSLEAKNSKNRLNERKATVAVANTLTNIKSNKRPSAIGVRKLDLSHSGSKIVPPTIQQGADGSTSVRKHIPKNKWAHVTSQIESHIDRPKLRPKTETKIKACLLKADATLPSSTTRHVRRMLSTATTAQIPGGITVRNRLSAQGRLITGVSRKSSSPEPTSRSSCGSVDSVKAARSSCGSVDSVKAFSPDDLQAVRAGSKGEIIVRYLLYIKWPQTTLFLVPFNQNSSSSASFPTFMWGL